MNWVASVLIIASSLNLNSLTIFVQVTCHVYNIIIHAIIIQRYQKSMILLNCISGEDIILESPESVNISLNGTAHQLNCTTIWSHIMWEINMRPFSNQPSHIWNNKGFKKLNESVNNMNQLKGALNVTGTTYNNNSTVQCIAFHSNYTNVVMSQTARILVQGEVQSFCGKPPHKMSQIIYVSIIDM